MAVDPNAKQWEQQAATGTGIPFAVTHQQAIAESGETDSPVSSAGARGFWQFLPSTYNANAAKAGVPTGSWNNPADETKVYIVYMSQLLRTEGGSIFKALEAYNAGPGNLSAGAGYASSILSKAGVPQSVTAGTPGVSTTSADISIPNPLNPLGDLTSGLANGIIAGILKAFGVPSFKDMFQRLGLILFGVALVIVGIRILSNGSKSGGNSGGGGGAQRSQSSEREEKPQKQVAAAKEPKGLGKGAGESSAVEGVGASEALEAAAIA
jgi:Transglycosylase SLT domain